MAAHTETTECGISSISTTEKANTNKIDDNFIGEMTSKDLLSVSEYEEMFKGRYTDEDESYLEAIKKPVSAPPVVHPWYNKPRRNFDYTARRGGGAVHRRPNRWSNNRGYTMNRQQEYRDGGNNNNNYRREQQHRPTRDNKDRYQPY